jgi:hypothetical protein
MWQRLNTIAGHVLPPAIWLFGIAACNLVVWYRRCESGCLVLPPAIWLFGIAACNLLVLYRRCESACYFGHLSIDKPSSTCS